MNPVEKMLWKMGDGSLPYSDCGSELFFHAAIYLDCTCSLAVELLNGTNKICTDIRLPQVGL